MFSNSLRKNDVGARVEFTSKVMGLSHLLLISWLKKTLKNGSDRLRLGQLTRQQRSKRRFLIKSELAFFKTFLWLSQVPYFVSVGELIKEKCSSSFMSSIKREIRHFHVMGVQWWQKRTCKVVDMLIKLSDWPYYAGTLTEYVEVRGGR